MDFFLRGLASIGAIWCMVTFLLLVHETGHLITLAYFKLKPDKIIIGNIRFCSLRINGVQHDFGLFPFFAFTVSKDYANAPHKQRTIVALAGPITSALLGVLLLLWNTYSPGWYTKMACQATFALAVWNLIPFPPMDGWPMMEWGLSKMGVKLTERGRAVLLGFGVASIAGAVWFSWH